MSNADHVTMLTNIHIALQDGDVDGVLPGAMLQQARRERGNMTATNAAWLANLESDWATQNAYARWEK